MDVFEEGRTYPLIPTKGSRGCPKANGQGYAIRVIKRGPLRIKCVLIKDGREIDVWSPAAYHGATAEYVLRVRESANGIPEMMASAERPE